MLRRIVWISVCAAAFAALFASPGGSLQAQELTPETAKMIFEALAGQSGEDSAESSRDDSSGSLAPQSRRTHERHLPLQRNDGANGASSGDGARNGGARSNGADAARRRMQEIAQSGGDPSSTNGEAALRNQGQAPGASGEAREKPAQPALRKYSARILLGDGRAVRGDVHLRFPEQILIQHSRDGMEYEKMISPEEIAAIEIQRWRGRFVREAREDKGKVYYFEPSAFALILTDGTRLEREGEIFPFLKDFALENRNGAVRLFTFWVDLQKPSGGWHTGMDGPAAGARNVPHPDVVRRIEFEGRGGSGSTSSSEDARNSRGGASDRNE